MTVKFVQCRNNGVVGWAKSTGPPSAVTHEFQAKKIFPLQWKLGHLDIKH